MRDEDDKGAPVPWEPDWTLPPGELIPEAVDLAGLRHDDVAEKLGLTMADYHELLAGQRELTDEHAEVLDALTGTPARLWLRMEQLYREDLAAGKKYVRYGADGGTT